MTRLIIWLPTLIYTAFILATLSYMPRLFLYLRGRFGSPAVSASTDIFFLVAAAVFFSYLLFAKRERRWRAYLWAAAITTGYAYFVLTLRNPSERIHFLEYGLLACLATSALRKEGMNRGNIYLWGFVITYYIGMADEAFQWLLPNRIGDARDVLFNGISGGMGELIVMLVLQPEGITGGLRREDLVRIAPWLALAAGFTWLFR